MDRQTLTEIMTRVSRREMQVPDAVEAIMNAGRQVAETSAPQPEVPEVPERSGPPEGILTTANAMETPRNGAPDVPEQTNEESTDASEQTDEEPPVVEDNTPEDPFDDMDSEVDFEADEGLMRSLNPDLNEEA